MIDQKSGMLFDCASHQMYQQRNGCRRGRKQHRKITEMHVINWLGRTFLFLGLRLRLLLVVCMLFLESTAQILNDQNRPFVD